LLNRLQNGSHRGKGSEVDQSTHGRMESGRVRKEESYRTKNVWIVIFGEEKSCLWVEENCVFTEKSKNKNFKILLSF
jgi:hypothetical protein